MRWLVYGIALAGFVWMLVAVVGADLAAMDAGDARGPEE